MNSLNTVMDKEACADAAREVLGFNGRMICGSKSTYWRAHRDNIIVFNANVCTQECGKIWHGDLDVTLDVDMLKALARRLNTTVFVLHEMDGRFDNEQTPLLDNARARVTADTIEIRTDNY